MRRVLSLSAVTIVLALAGTAGAHQIVESAVPAAGSTVGGVVDVARLTFTEPWPTEATAELLTISEEPIESQVLLVEDGVLWFEFEPLTSAGPYIVDYAVVYADGTDDASRYVFTYDPAAESTGLVAPSSVPWPMLAVAVAAAGAVGMIVWRRRG